MKDRLKCIIVFLIVFALMAGGLTGCKKDSVQNKASGKGRYIEEDMELPVKEGQEQLISLSKSGKGNPLIFAVNYLEAEVIRYEYKEGKWEEREVDWFKKLYGGQMPVTGGVRDMQETADGTQVIIMQGHLDNPDFMIRGEIGGEGEELEVSCLTQKSGGGYPGITDIVIDDEGKYWLKDTYGSRVTVLSPETLESVKEIEIVYGGNSFPEPRMLAKGQDGSIAVQTEKGSYTLYHAASLEEWETLNFEKDEWPELCSDGSNWYAVSEKGISRMKPGNDMTEVVMDGGLGMMGLPLYKADSIIMGNEDDFYVLYGQQQEFDYRLRHYVYDPDVAATPEITLTVFGLTDNDTVRQGMQEFQKENPDVRVVFNSSGKTEDEVTTDDIRTLNTELLSGNGADVLLMDGLPLDSYIEKGMLEDLTDFTEELKKEGPFMENILKNTAQKEGEIYALPVKFNVPIMYGSQEIQDALQSIDSLKKYLEAKPDASVFGAADHWYIMNVLFQLFQEEIIGSNGKVNQDKLEVLLDLEKKISENVGSQRFEELNDITEKDQERSNPFFTLGECGILKYSDAVVTVDIYSALSMAVSYALMRQTGMSPVSIQNLYHPVGIVGINKNSRQKEAAKDFVKMLFSEKVQSVQLDAGFPVLESALKNQTEVVDSKYMKTMAIGWTLDTEDGQIEFRAMSGEVTKEEVQSIIDMSRTLTKPLKQDRAVWGIYQESAEKYLEGSMDAKEAVETIAQKVDTYLAE